MQHQLCLFRAIKGTEKHPSAQVGQLCSLFHMFQHQRTSKKLSYGLLSLKLGGGRRGREAKLIIHTWIWMKNRTSTKIPHPILLALSALSKWICSNRKGLGKEREREKKGIWKYTIGLGPTLRHTYMFQGWKLNAEENSEQLTPRWQILLLCRTSINIDCKITYLDHTVRLYHSIKLWHWLQGTLDPGSSSTTILTSFCKLLGSSD